jgi:hypothetical protein
MSIHSLLRSTILLTSVSIATTFGHAAGSYPGTRARVIVDSVASDSYREAQAARGPEDIETYHVMKGQFFSGLSRDGSLNRVSFQDVVNTLAENLSKRNYLPSDDIKKGDLLLIVHYGVAAVDADWDELMGINSEEEEAALYGSTTAAENTETRELELTTDSSYNTPATSSFVAQSNASLLGFDRQLNKPNIT